MKELRGVVDTCYIDYDNRGQFTALIKTDSGQIKITSWYLQYPQAHIQIGDSIVKETETFKYLIYKKDLKLVVVDEKFNCDYWEKFRK